jgi:hypothetical protein
MHKAACDQLIFVGDAVLRHLNQMVGKRGPGELCGDGHSPWSIISRPCAIESPREQEL